MRVLPVANFSCSINNQSIKRTQFFKGNNDEKDFVIEFHNVNGSARETIALNTTQKHSVVFERSFNEYSVPILKEILAAKESGDPRFVESSYYDSFHDTVLRSVRNEHQASVAKYILDSSSLMNSPYIKVYAGSIISASNTADKATLAKHILDNPKLVENGEFMNRVPNIVGLTKNKRELKIKLKAVDEYAQGGKFSETRMVEGKSF